MNEREFQKVIIDALKSVGCWVFNVHGHRYQKSGLPDCYVAASGWSGWLEFKVGSGRPTALQIMNMKDLLVRNVPAFVVRLRDDNIYCEMWGGRIVGGGEGGRMETLGCCLEWKRNKGITLGMGLIKMFKESGNTAIEIIREIGK